MKKYKSIFKENLDENAVAKVIGRTIGPNSSGRMAIEISKINKPSFKEIEKIISNSWGPNLTKRVMDDLVKEFKLK